MKKLKFKSLTIRIWITFTSAILIIVTCISLLYLFAFRKIDEKSKAHDLMVSHNAVLENDGFVQPNRFNEVKSLKDSKHFILEFRDNVPRIADISPGGGLHPVPPIGDENRVKAWMCGFAKEDNMEAEKFKESYGNSSYIFIITSIKREGATKAYVISYVPNKQDYSIVYTILIIGAIFIFIGFFIARVIANYISRPLKELEGYTMKIANKDWKDAIRIESDDEIGRLADSMNAMRKELKRADEEEKMFLQSISHDLKTPVMVIMSHADAIIDGVYVESVEKTAEIIRDEAINLEKKIRQILYLNTLNYVMESNKEVSEINLKNLLLHIVSRFEVVNSKIEWDLDIEDAVIYGNVDQIQVSIENIIENGLRYVKNIIAINLKKDESFVVLEIYNDGPNINNQHIEHIFDNMYKDKTGNFGLGLAITKKVINYYGGEIKAVNRENGVSFIIELPIVKKTTSM
ncbi:MULTISPECIES: HAMP domain-containing sensor histidine kinase [Clostridium]|uniref:Signal transduction histidine-protein kinase/phosphatase MprB n=1 Tax=Clostridium cibarium TaxID=2762247 RepID=A0ABR8PXD4_9CLOT|nr:MULTISPECIES: HAMP domain-containing sensor histidine kinase [Clostridium]MBD7912803.1 HAMP domain-containing histidine kinase [Clostridium cibarium]